MDWTKILDAEVGLVLTPPFRCMYPALSEPVEYAGKNYYQVVALFHPRETLNSLRRLILMLGAERFPRITNLKLPIRDGSEMNNELYHGHLVIKLKSQYTIQLKDVNGDDLTDPLLIYPGCWGRALITISAFSHPQQKGISAYLRVFQLLNPEAVSLLYDTDIDSSRILPNVKYDNELFRDELAKKATMPDITTIYQGEI